MSLLQHLTAATAGLSYESIVDYIANRLRVNEQDALDSAARFETNLGLDKAKLMAAAHKTVAAREQALRQAVTTVDLSSVPEEDQEDILGVGSLGQGI